MNLQKFLSQRSGRGFIALMSVIILTVTLLLAVVALGSRGIMGRLALLDFDRKTVSQSLAESCVAVAQIYVANDANYSASGVTVPVGYQHTCTLILVSPNTPVSGQSTIKTSGIVRGATTYLKVVVNSSTLATISWLETANAP